MGEASSGAESTHGPVLSDVVCTDRGSSQRFWIIPEYLLMFAKPGPLSIPIVTSGSTSDAIPGALDQANTKVLFGNNNINYPAMNGFRVTFGMYVDPDNKCGVDVSLFMLENAAVNFLKSNNGSDPTYVLAVPYISVNTNGEGSYPFTPTNLLGSPVKSLDSVLVSSASQLYGAEINGAFNLSRSGGFHVDFLGGFRYLNLQESFDLKANYSVTNLDTSVTTTTASDSFQASNQFFGGQAGLRVNYLHGSFFTSATLKAALGVNFESSTISGSTTQANSLGGSTVYSGGIFAQPTNIGRQTMLPLSAVPQLSAKIGWELAPVSGCLGAMTSCTGTTSSVPEPRSTATSTKAKCSAARIRPDQPPCRRRCSNSPTISFRASRSASSSATNRDFPKNNGSFQP